MNAEPPPSSLPPSSVPPPAAPPPPPSPSAPQPHVVHRITIAPGIVPQLLAWHREAQGVEPCALLVGRLVKGGLTIESCKRVENVSGRPDRTFLIPPVELLAAEKAAREQGRTVVGTWHGHPEGPAWPSVSDGMGLAAATMRPGAAARPDWRPHAFLVSGQGAGPALVVRAFVRRQGRPCEVPLLVDA